MLIKLVENVIGPSDAARGIARNRYVMIGLQDLKMNAVNTLKETELVIAGLSKSDKKQILRWLERDIENGSAGIEKNPDVMGGAACIRRTRIPVWLLQQARTQGVSEADLLHNYPGLTAEDLVNAWAYVAANSEEIANQIADNERED